MNQVLKTKYPKIPILEIVHAAYRTNGYSCISANKPETGRAANYKMVANTISYFFKEKKEVSGVLAITDEDKEWAKEFVKYSERLVLQLMKDGLQEFILELYKTSLKEEYDNTDISILVWLPGHIRDMQLTTEVVKTCKKGTGVFTDSIINTSVVIIAKMHKQEYNNYLYTGVVERNLVSFYHKSSLDIGKDYVIISSKLKNTYTSKRYNNLPVTAINYVKLR
jgi:hypothetical protein